MATLALTSLSLVWAQPSATAAAATLTLVEAEAGDVYDGALLFAHHCAACHGKTGAGFAEAKQAFPPSHRNCQRCHRPGNPAELPLEGTPDTSMFNLGRPPAVLGDDARMVHLTNEAGLLAYVRATMPRWNPGSLTDREYESIVAFMRAAREKDATSP